MNTSIIIKPDKKILFQQLIDELKFALRGLTTAELIEIFLESSKIAIKTTYKTKEKAVKNSWAFAKNTFKRYQVDGMGKSFKTDFEKGKNAIEKLPKKTKEIYDTFIKLDREKQIEVVAIAVFSAAIFFTVSGGTDFEGGLPDADTAILGIGGHRHIISHSILLGLGFEFAGRFAILILGKIRDRLPEYHHRIWDKVYEFLDENKNIAIGAMWFGIGTHLLKDTGIIAGGVKPYVGLPVSMPMEGHQALFAANGIAASLFGVDGVSNK